MGEGRIDSRVVIRAPIARVFERLIDHEGMAKWPGICSCKLVKEGTPRNGLGAVRRIRAGGLTLDEEVVPYEPPRAFDYAIIRGLPIDRHRGTIRLAEVEGGVEIDWRIRISSAWPFVAEIIAIALRRGLPKALRYLTKELEREGP